jgi:hypothetical protein
MMKRELGQVFGSMQSDGDKADQVCRRIHFVHEKEERSKLKFPRVLYPLQHARRSGKSYRCGQSCGMCRPMDGVNCAIR